MIAAVHATAPSWEQTDWVTICAAYDKLVAIDRFTGGAGQPGAGHRLPRRLDAGLAALDKVAHDPRLARSNLVPTIRADLLRRPEAREGDWTRR